jgi:hypothetical protein
MRVGAGVSEEKEADGLAAARPLFRLTQHERTRGSLAKKPSKRRADPHEAPCKAERLERMGAAERARSSFADGSLEGSDRIFAHYFRANSSGSTALPFPKRAVQRKPLRCR